MRKIVISILFMVMFVSKPGFMYSQQKIFTRMDISLDGILGVTQDRQGYIWFIARNNGLYRYDGSQFVSYVHDVKDSTSITGAPLESIAVDSNDNVWIGSFNGGLDKFDPATNKFTHFRHQTADGGSLANDTVTAILVDHNNDVWVGNYGGLDLYDRRTGKFTHYPSKMNDPTSLSSNEIRVIYEDKKNVLWIGCGEPFPPRNSNPASGGLNSFDKVTGKFTHYFHDPANTGSIAGNKVRAILEDSKGNFWVGTDGDGLQTLDRNTGKFTHYYYDSAHPRNLSRASGPITDHVTFIREDIKGKIWIGTMFEGIYEYDPQTKKIKHYGGYIKSLAPFRVDGADTSAGFPVVVPWTAFSGKGGILWIGTFLDGGGLFKVNPVEKAILPFTVLPHENNIGGGNTFYKDGKGTLWIGTIGLMHKDGKTGAEKIYLHDAHNSNSLIDDNVLAIAEDSIGIFWIGTQGGLDRFDPQKEIFTHYRHDSAIASGLINNAVNVLLFDAERNLWVATNEGLDKMNTATGQFSHFLHGDKDSNSLSNSFINLIAEYKTDIWAATANGLNKVNKTSGAITRYLPNNNVTCVVIDAAGIVWAGATGGLYRYNITSNDFSFFDDPNIKLDHILHILKDDQQNLWISAASAIYKIDKARKNIRIFGNANGVHPNTFGTANNYKTKEGELLIGDQFGYYHFFPRDIEDAVYPPVVNITGFQIGGKDIEPGSGSVLSDRISITDKITLGHAQNSFAVSFSAIHFSTPGEERYLYMLQNYDNTWHDASILQKVYFFSLPIGHYTLRIRAINVDGVWAEKDLDIVISPPWWATWWAITLFALLLAGVTWSFIYYRSRRLIRENKVLEEKVKHRTDQLQKSIEDLKSTQSQLMQSEKMASLGELTAGIAHEIQNPLNFMNNFSEVNKELLVEMKDEIDKGNMEEVRSLADDVIANEEKISHHGKRADAIVKGMLQHSRSGTSTKEPADINALADEYLRLSYHGLRAKDKSFNAIMYTDFDKSIGMINIIPQDMGRVLLNLYNNAFYAVSEKKKQRPEGYEPGISVSTKKAGDKITIAVGDNGNGITQKVHNKIFQPFFTTKPTGQGTGLGLSLSYDIIKAHGGNIQMNTKEGEGTTFTIVLPIT